MPIYDYRCDHCGHAFSQLQSFHDEALSACPNCGKRPRRLITAPAIVFKGSGWYKTDSRAPSATEKSEKAEAKTASEKADKGGGKGEAKTDTKPEAKPDRTPERTPARTSEPSKPATKSSGGEAAS